MRPRAFCHIRDLPHYRRDCFETGLRAAGFDLAPVGRPDFRPGDVLVIWNRYGHYDQLAGSAERAGAVVICSENGFVGRDAQGRQFYQLAVGSHNGGGWWRVGEGDRLTACGIQVATDWAPTSPDAPIVIRGQRGIGRPIMASPPDWHVKMAARLRPLTHRRILVIPHPGNGAPDNKDHEQYLSGAHALVIWSSSVGVKALVAGVPVVCDARFWVCKTAGFSTVAIIEESRAHELRSARANELRLEALRRMAWAQWSIDEIATGHPIRFLLDGYEQYLQSQKEERPA